MGYPHKIATCCYCGTRAALVLKGVNRHELACSACGAPLHNLKMLRSDKLADRDRASLSRVRARPGDPTRGGYGEERARLPRTRKGKRRKSMFKKIFEEAFDVIEDIFD